MLRRILVYALLSLFIFPGTRLSAVPAPEKPADDLRKSILALDSAWTRVLSDLQEKKKNRPLPEDERREYARFITYLSGRIDEYCQQLRLAGGQQAIVDLPCPVDDSLPAGTGNALTPSKAEQIAALDKELTEKLGEFDEQLLREEQKISSRRPAGRETGSGYGSAGGSGGGTGAAGSPGSQGQAGTGSRGRGGTAGDGGQAGGTAGAGSQPGSQGTGTSDSGGSQSGQGTGTSAGGAGEGTGQSGAPGQESGMQEIESGYDDIVARQLREAAEKETDPELKEKLWEEYRKYKEGIR